MTLAKTTDEYWSELYDSGRDFSLISSEAISKILSYLPYNADKTCLDIGCGTGQLTRELYHRGYRCIGLDAAKSGIRIAQSLTTVPQDTLLYRQFNIERDQLADLPSRQYSLITCKLVYAFIEDKPAFIARVKQLLAPNGMFVVITPHTDDVPETRRRIAINNEEFKILTDSFERSDSYKEGIVDYPLTYFIGR